METQLQHFFFFSFFAQQRNYRVTITTTGSFKLVLTPQTSIVCNRLQQLFSNRVVGRGQPTEQSGYRRHSNLPPPSPCPHWIFWLWVDVKSSKTPWTLNKLRRRIHNTLLQWGEHVNIMKKWHTYTHGAFVLAHKFIENQGKEVEETEKNARGQNTSKQHSFYRMKCILKTDHANCTIFFSGVLLNLICLY